ncbi:MAG TPA: 3-hydroxyacyl-CoA dehydrogenase NAD-binding domain-containing protein [Microlunatus sp.]|nr:3-hydroxyacyl-CoA dehydrogenase NAD-binding domain-containing protein [Microlunatus sp.]
MSTTDQQPLMPEDELQALLADASALTPDERVTRFLSRDIVLPHTGRTAVLITLDNGEDHTKPNTLGPRSLAAYNDALTAALARDDVAAIAITGKPFILAAGADLKALGGIAGRDQAVTIARLGHAVFDKLHSSSVPTFAFINGLALGGGLEIGLHAHYRTVSRAAAGIALPECFLGLLPGWGGTYLLPNLIGADRAVQVIIENALSQNKMLLGPQVAQLGIADAIFDGADFLADSLDWAGRVVAGEISVDRPEIDRGEAWDAAVQRGRRFADQKTSGAAPAPHRALDAIALAKTADRVTAYDGEDQGLADLIMSEELRSGLYAFDLVQRRAKKPAGAPESWLARPVTSVGIVGAGLMASQLALLFLRRLEVPVIVSDLDAERVQQGIGYVHAELDELARKKRIGPDQVNRYKALLSGTTEHADYAGCDFVIEAVFEELTIKKEVFASLEKHVSAECVLATNTSSLSISEMAADLTHPERVVGFHFFNPVAVLPLLEVIKGASTDDETTATALSVAKTLRKNAVLVSDAPAFVVNRLLIRTTAVITRAVDEGTPVEVADAALRPLGLPMPPFVLLQLVGPAVALHVTETLHAAFGDRFPVSENLKALVAARKPGIYDLTADGRPYVSEETRALLQTGDDPSTAEELRARVEEALAEEIGLMLAEGVVAAPMDIDLCLILGAGWPFHLGGITPYLDRTGVSERVLGRRFLPKGVATLP